MNRGLRRIRRQRISCRLAKKERSNKERRKTGIRASPFRIS
jgi:hypothetical protein